MLVVGVDLGTSSAKAVAFDTSGNARAAAAVEVPLRATAAGRLEQDPDTILDAAATAVGKVVADLDGTPIAGLALSAAMHTLLGVDADGIPTTPALLYADARAEAQAAALRALPDAATLVARTGTPLHAMAPLAKLRWFAEEDPATAARTAAWISTKEYLLRAACDAAVVDHSIASTTGLFDLTSLAWDPAALALAGVDRGQLGEPVAATTVLGLAPGWAERCGVPGDTPVVVGGADGCLANLGAGVVDAGVAALTIGTSGAVRTTVPSGAPTVAAELFRYALLDGLHVVGGPISNGGVVLRWARDTLLPELAADAAARGMTPYAYFDELAATVPAGAESLLFLPSLLGERAPHWDAAQRGVLFGLSARHGRAHVLRALLEGVAHQLATVADLLATAMGPIERLRANGGFTASPLWLQIVADVLDRPLEVPRSVEGSCLGAALVGFQALGHGAAATLARDTVRVARVVEPSADAAVHRRAHPVFVQLRERLQQPFADLATLRDDST